MENQESMSQAESEAICKFMMQYGAFLSNWGYFEMQIEVLIWHLTKTKENNLSPLANCRKINALSGHSKCERLKPLLRKTSHQDVLDALEKAYNIADRNGWIHGHIMQYGHNFERIARFRYDKNEGLDYKPLSLDMYPFPEFSDVVTEFGKVIEKAFGIAESTIDDYMQLAKKEQKHENESKPTS